MRRWTQLELEPRRVISISCAHWGSTPPTGYLWFHPRPAPRPSLIDPASLGHAPFFHWLLFSRSSPVALNHAPTLYWLFFSRLAVPSRFGFSSLVHAGSPALTEHALRAAPKALGLKRGQGAPAGLSSRRAFGRSRGGAPPRMRSRSIDLVPDTGRPRSRSCCRSSET